LHADAVVVPVGLRGGQQGTTEGGVCGMRAGSGSGAHNRCSRAPRRIPGPCCPGAQSRAHQQR
jgi:hypothetical protein